ncbi:MAG TPA: type II secretion system F family protein [Betaproteobacteria bacterium]|nr:type II secretion system F family protein [Betaproteobacteria bacterium]
MPVFAYKAINEEGRFSRGQLEADTLEDLEQRLTRLGLDLIKGKPTGRRMLLVKRRVTRRDLINVCFHLEQLNRAGVPLMDGLADLRDSIDHPRLGQVLANIIERIQGGKLFSEALAAHPTVFDEVFVNLVKAGEESGQLPEVFKKLTDSLKWQDEIAAHMKKLILYPAFVAVVVLAVTFFLMIYLVPKLVSFLKDMGQTLPPQTQALIAVSNFFVHYWYIVLIAPIALFITIKALAKTHPGVRYQVDRFKLNLWVVGPILRKIILARFTTFFAMMYAAGITVLDGIRISQGIATNRVIVQGLQLAERMITDGLGFTESFRNTGLFPPLVTRMLRVGEATGGLDTALLNVSYFYDRDVKESIDRLQAVIEPALTVILGLLMAWIMLAVLGPIYDTITRLKY